MVRRDMAGPDIEGPDARIVSSEASRDSIGDTPCVRYHYRFSRPSKQGGPPEIESVHGVMILHPTAPNLLINLYNTDAQYFRDESSVAPALAAPEAPPDADGEEFISSMRLVGRDGRCQYSDTTGFDEPQGVGVGHGSIWVAQLQSGTVLRIDPSTGRTVARIAVGHSPVGVAMTADAVWVANKADGTVSRIDPAANQVVATITVGREPLVIAPGSDALWVANQGDGTISRIELASSQQKPAKFKVGGEPSSVLFHDGVLWVTDYSQGRLLRIDPVTGKALGKEIAVGAGPNDIAFGGGSIWVNCQNREPAVWRIDPSTGAVQAKVPSTRRPSGIAFGHDRLWICDVDDGSVVGIDPATNKLGPPIRAGIGLVCIRAAEDGVWATDQIGSAVIRIPYK